MASETIEQMLKREQAADRISRLRRVCDVEFRQPISDEELKAWLDATICERRTETLKRELANFDTPDLFLMKNILEPPKPALVVVPPTPVKEEVVIKHEQQRRARSKPAPNAH